MEKYLNMKNPPRFSGEWKKYMFFFLDIVFLGAMVLLTKGINTLFHLSLTFTLFNYVWSLVIWLIIIWRPFNNPGQRQIFLIIESLVFADNNHYHALDPNRKYHGKA